nr:hypothetical protein [Mycolicibacterium gilvum]
MVFRHGASRGSRHRSGVAGRADTACGWCRFGDSGHPGT